MSEYQIFWTERCSILLSFIICFYFCRYAKNAKRLSALYRDRDQDPLEKAVYWVEYVARHRAHLMIKPANQDWWYERCLLDVAVVVIVAVAATSYFAKRVLAKIRIAVATDHH